MPIIKFFKKVMFMFLSFAITAVMVFLLAEGFLRYQHKKNKPKQSRSRWYELAHDWDKKDIHMKAVNATMGVDKYYNYFFYAPAPYSSETINFTDFYSSRLCPDSVPLKDAQDIIWTFGGSTMQNSETSDELTIANQIAVALNKENQSVLVHNFGTYAFQTSMELIKFQELLRRVDEKKRPSIAVFYDGYNDASFAVKFGAGNMYFYLAQNIKMFREHKWGNLVRYLVSHFLQGRSLFFKKFLFPYVIPKELLKDRVWDFSEANMDKAVSIYLDNIAMVKATCAVYNVDPVIVLQPLLITKQGLSDFEATCNVNEDTKKAVLYFYDKVRKALKDDEDFLDLSGIFDNNGKSNFYDFGHTGPYSGIVTGKAISAFITKKKQKNNSEDI